MERVKQTRRRKGFTRISRKNQVTIPIDALAIAGVGPGDTLMVEARPTGEIVLRREEDPLERYIGAFNGVYPPGYLDELRDEWER